ncbi:MULTISPECIES: LamG domain-containing protein [Flavobacterium]|uniref:LamG domain-containing protein n=1 Tax=Flavobacterium TaxID=237 RepID=UPI001FCAB38E|nr:MULTISPECIES: LamG domain-containing protein [Flavobacterium]UOK42137.1 LamG domain-containing protein [Flavobacterium enshiense]
MNFNLKKISLLLIFTSLFSCNDNDTNETSKTQASCLSTNLQNGVIAFYPFSNGSINDFSGNNYHLTNTTTASSGPDRAGNLNCAYNFISANGDFLKYTNPTFLDNFQNSPFSISLWYKPTGNNWSFETLIGRTYTTNCPNSAFGQWSINLHDCRKAAFEANQNVIWDDYFNSNGCDETTADLSNVWQHIVVSYDGTSNVKLYRNNVLTTQTSSTNSNCSSSILGDLFLGKNYTGLLDDVIIYNRILTQTEMTELYNLQACCQ